MLIRKVEPGHVQPSEITPESVFLQRRQFLSQASQIALTGFAGIHWSLPVWAKDIDIKAFAPLPGVKPNPSYQDPSLKTAQTRFEDLASYNNFYEFGFEKTDPKERARNFRTRPWTIKVHGHVEKAADYQLEDFIKPHALEDRIYRFRCVEAWSMVVPWVGFPLRAILERAKPTSKAKFVLFKTLLDPEQMPMQKTNALPWPYQEGLRLDEALHDLTLLVVGVYGRVLPNQNGAPLRLIVPWKYGYKSIKSVVSIELVDYQPKTTWEMQAPEEYPFYSNVNPDAAHPRWSQKTERVLGSGLFSRRQPTLPFNGYAKQVADLYKGFNPKTLY